MCGIAGIAGKNWKREQIARMNKIQRHRGPDASGVYCSPQNTAALAHNRLSIIDLSAAGNQPLIDDKSGTAIVYNGEIYNYLELRRELASEFDFRTQTDTEVLHAAYLKWGADCLDKLVGMFAFAVWNDREQTLFAARDRFGVKPFYFYQANDTLFFASEIKALHCAGSAAEFDEETWAAYLNYGLHDHSEKTFWRGIESLAPGHFLQWKNGRTKISKWYDLAEKTGADFDERSDREVAEEYYELLKESVRMRFRADVPIGINLSGGVDSSSLLALVQAIEGNESRVSAYTFTTGNEYYDELPWVRRMLAKTKHPLTNCLLDAKEVPAMAKCVQAFQDEPFGGIPTLAYAKIFAQARKDGVTVLLDGSGMDEQWAGYDYYATDDVDNSQIVQGTREKAVRPDCLSEEFRRLAKPLAAPSFEFPDRLRNLQFRDTRYTKIPRAMRFNDRVSMRAAIELREPFLDHRLFELAFRQPAPRKIENGINKKMLRDIVKKLMPESLVDAPKRPLQTPQREWLRGDLRDWAESNIAAALEHFGGIWLNRQQVESEWEKFCRAESDNSFYVWQWISLSLMNELKNARGGNFESICHRSK